MDEEGEKLSNTDTTTAKTCSIEIGISSNTSLHTNSKADYSTTTSGGQCDIPEQHTDLPPCSESGNLLPLLQLSSTVQIEDGSDTIPQSESSQLLIQQPTCPVGSGDTTNTIATVTLLNGYDTNAGKDNCANIDSKPIYSHPDGNYSSNVPVAINTKEHNQPIEASERQHVIENNNNDRGQVNLTPSSPVSYGTEVGNVRGADTCGKENWALIGSKNREAALISTDEEVSSIPITSVGGDNSRERSEKQLVEKDPPSVSAFSDFEDIDVAVLSPDKIPATTVADYGNFNLEDERGCHVALSEELSIRDDDNMTSPFEHCSLDENVQPGTDQFRNEMSSRNEADTTLNVLSPSQFSAIVDSSHSQSVSATSLNNSSDTNAKTNHVVDSPYRDINSRSAKRDSDAGTGGPMRPFSVQTTRNNSLSSGIFSLKSTTDSTTASASSSSISPASSTSSVEMLDLELHRMKTSTKFAYATLVAVLLGDSCRCNMTCGDVGEGDCDGLSSANFCPEETVKLHEKYLKEYLHGLKNHLDLPENIEHTLYAHAIVEDGLSLLDDYVNCILMDPYFTKTVPESEAKASEVNSMSPGTQSSECPTALPTKTSSSNFSRHASDVLDLTNDSAYQKKPSSVLVLDALQVSIRKGTFDARSREMCMRLNKALGLLVSDYDTQETMFVDFMQSAAEQYQMSEEEKKAHESSRKKSKRKRYLAIGLAAVGGGALIGLTGGLAAPLVAGGIGALIGGAGAAFMASTAGLVVITSVFGTGGAGLVGYRMKRRVGNVEQFEFNALSPGVGLHVAIAVPGWLREGEVISQQWAALDISPEQYCLLWDTKYLLELGRSLEYLKDMVVNAAMSQALKYTVLSSVMAAVAWPAALLGASSVIDNPWSVANSRSVQAGKELAEVLLTRQHGCRPVTLVGVSLGAKVIYQCLEEIHSRGLTPSQLGIIHNVVLVGAPCSGKPEDWARLAPLISGQVINAFSQGDWMLKFIYRSSSLRAKIAGLGPIGLEPKVVNVDLTDVIPGHLDYLDHMPEVLAYCGIKCKPTQAQENKFSLSTKRTNSQTENWSTNEKFQPKSPNTRKKDWKSQSSSSSPAARSGKERSVSQQNPSNLRPVSGSLANIEQASTENNNPSQSRSKLSITKSNSYTEF